MTPEFRYIIMARLQAILLLLIPINVSAQTFENTFVGEWGDTYWTFSFHQDGTYKRTSWGHYGNTTVEGSYITQADTVHLLSGFENTNGTVNEKYLLDKDSMLIDVDLRYDYSPISKTRPDLSDTNRIIFEPYKLGFYNSAIRNIKYPQTPASDTNTIADLETVLNMALNTPEIMKYYHFDEVQERRLVIANYYYLAAQITVKGKVALWKPEEEIKEPFYLEFDDINQNSNRINIEERVSGEGASVWFYYTKENGEWMQDQEPFIMENSHVIFPSH